MPRRSSSYRQPVDWLVDGTWPDGEFDAEAPPALAHAVAIANALASALDGLNKSSVCAEANIERSTLYDLLGGKSWADTITLANLERTLGVTLWPLEPSPRLRRRN